jgi:hypothetical protein
MFSIIIPTLTPFHTHAIVSFRSYDTHALIPRSFSHAQCSASHIAASPYLVVALLVHCNSQPRAFAGKAACSLWCGYRIVYCAIPARDPSLIDVSLFVSGTLSLFQSGVWHIHDHGTPLRCTFTASCICVSCSGSASCPMLHKFRKIQDHFVCTTCLYPHLPQFILSVFVAALRVHLLA